MNITIANRDRMLTVEVRHLDDFVAVATELNFSWAAQRIHVVQSALSAAVSRLEKELDVELFDRSKRQIALTPAGEVFLQHAREVIHTAHRARTSVDAFREQLTGTVTLGTLMSWGTLNLPAALEEFRRSNPLLTVRLRQSLPPAWPTASPTYARFPCIHPSHGPCRSPTPHPNKLALQLTRSSTP